FLVASVILVVLGPLAVVRRTVADSVGVRDGAVVRVPTRRRIDRPGAPRAGDAERIHQPRGPQHVAEDFGVQRGALLVVEPHGLRRVVVGVAAPRRVVAGAHRRVARGDVVRARGDAARALGLAVASVADAAPRAAPAVAVAARIVLAAPAVVIAPVVAAVGRG